jgi:hypothetical protein
LYGKFSGLVFQSSVRLQVDGAEVFVVTLGIQGIDADKVDARLGKPEDKTAPHAALRIEVQFEFALDDGGLEGGQFLLSELFLADDEVADGHSLSYSMRVVVGEHELEGQRLPGLDLEEGARRIAPTGGSE